MRNYVSFVLVAALTVPAWADNKPAQPSTEERARVEKVDPPIKPDVVGNALIGGVSAGVVKGAVGGVAAGAAAAAVSTVRGTVVGGVIEKAKEAIKEKAKPDPSPSHDVHDGPRGHDSHRDAPGEYKGRDIGSIERAMHTG